MAGGFSRAVGVPTRSKSWTFLTSVAAFAAAFISLPPALAQSSDVTSSGTGFFISADGWIMTNAHVVEGCRWITVAGHGDVTDQMFGRCFLKGAAGGRRNGKSGPATLIVAI